METTQIKPSADARHFFANMVNVADNNFELSLLRTLQLSIEIQKSGRNDEIQSYVSELQQEGWIRPSPNCGWLVG